MGHKNKVSLVRQIQDNLQSKLAIGESKHDAKSDGSYINYIYSYSTFKNYMKHCNYFADYCKKEHNAKTIDECKQYANEYIQHRRNEGVSPFTQKLEVSALGKLYGESLFSKIETDSRHRNEITRSRLDCAMDRHFSEKNNKELIDFCRSTGLRRSELENLTGSQLIQKEDGNYYIHTSGKGGKERDAKIIGSEEQIQAVINKIQSVGPDEKVWGRVHSGADIHSYRSDYATAYYDEIARDISTLDREERYDCRGDLAGTSYDREAMLEVSQSLGHNRVDVIALNYLRR